ncbi:MAG: hypothetical protein ABI539_13595 [Acidobacteriota bacterium]
MEENNIIQPNASGGDKPEIIVNDYGQTLDSAVVVEEPGRTVMLTEDQTIIIEKEPQFDIAPKDRPRKVYGGMWGQTEIATVGLAVLALLTVALLYFLMVLPAKREIEGRRAERDRLEAELVSARSKYGDITNTETRVAKLITSVDDFETRFLPVAATGQTALYQRLNGLIAAYGLTNTNGPDYSPLELADLSQTKEEERGRAKFRSLFPGVYVTMTLEGSYQNLRRFIREIETGNEFVVVSSVELEPSDAEQRPDVQTAPPKQPQQQASMPARNQQFGPNAGNPSFGYQSTVEPPVTRQRQGKTHGEVVSLRLEMAAYFRRQTAAPENAGQ